MAGSGGGGDASQDHLARLALSSVAKLERVDVEPPVSSTSAARVAMVSWTRHKYGTVLCVTCEVDEVQASASHHRLPLHGHSMEERAAMGLRLHSA